MKNIYLFFLLGLVMSCSKNGTNPVPVKRVVVTYDFTTDRPGNFQIGYVDSTNNPINISFTGIHWTKSITMTGLTGLQKVMFAVTATQHNYAGLANAKIIVDAKTNANFTYQFEINRDNFAFCACPW